MSRGPILSYPPADPAPPSPEGRRGRRRSIRFPRIVPVGLALFGAAGGCRLSSEEADAFVSRRMAGFYVAIAPDEIVDFLVGFSTYDTRGDDLPLGPPPWDVTVPPRGEPEERKAPPGAGSRPAP